MKNKGNNANNAFAALTRVKRDSGDEKEYGFLDSLTRYQLDPQAQERHIARSFKVLS